MMKRWLAMLLVLAMMVSFAACTASDTPPETTTQTPTQTTLPPTTEPPEPTAFDLFAEQVEKLNASDAITMSVDVSEERTVWGETFTQEIDSEIVYEGLQDTLVAELNGTMYFNDEIYFDISEFFVDGHTYATFDATKHKEESTAEEFLARQYPICLFDAENFGECNAEEIAQGTRLTFTEPMALESWAAAEYAELISAEASVLIGEDGIEEMTYTATFAQGAADVTLTVETELMLDCVSVLKAEAPEDADKYMLVSDVEIPRIIERAYFNLYKSKSRSAQIMQIISSQAAGYAVMSSTDLNEYSSDGDYIVKREQSFMEYTTGGESSYETEDLYLDGNYTFTFDGESETEKFSASTMRDFMQDVFTDYVMTGAWITEAELSDLGEGLLIEFGSEDETCQDYMKELTIYEVFGDENPLDEVATAYEAKKVTGYMGVDKDTWLPTSYSMEFTGRHTIEGYPCELSQQFYAGFMPADPRAYESITEEKLPEKEPEEKASPVFYHVTGENGEEMWLLGTIHIGDERTAYLPQEIYDAFDASDALAVEFDMNSFEDRVEEDEEYLKKIAKLYYYDDGSTIDAHLEDEVFLEALKHMKYHGDYNPNAERMKVALWENSISNSLVYESRRLFSEKGVDQRLLDRAEEQEKEILDVESAEAQMEMLMGFSEELQAFLLTQAMETKRSEYAQEASELYELWCSGDEAALIAYINVDETEDMTEDELKLYNEYETAMNKDRDVEMVKIAKEYLSSGKVVFYAVGLAHLLKEDGLVDSLRAAGYQVELVSYAK